MKSTVPFLREEVIESEDELLLAEYGREHGLTRARSMR